MEMNGPADLSEGLAEIELLISQRNLDRAQSLAQQLLLSHPNNAGVHAALGNIAAARQQHREAIEWYELSLRLEPNQQVRERLARERDLLDTERFREFEEEQPQRDKRPLIIGGAIGAFLLLALIVALIASAMGRRARVPTTEGQRAGRPIVRTNQAGQPEQGTTPGGLAARPEARAGQTGPYGVGAGSAVAPPAGTPPGDLRVTQSVDAPLADRDVLLTRALAALTWPNGESLGWRVMGLMDPFTGYALITVEVPPAMRGQNLFPPVISMAYKLATAAMNTDRGIDSLTIRVLTGIQNEKGRDVELVAFRGNTTRESMDYYLKRGIQPDQQTIWANVFATTWWNPAVPAGSSTAAAGAEQPAAPAPATRR